MASHWALPPPRRSAAFPAILRAQALPAGAPEIKLGQCQPYSGPASAFGNVGRAEGAYFAMVNDQGGVNGHRVNLISLDDGYSPPKTVELTRRMVEEDQVTAIFASLGTAPNSAIAKYLNQKKVPDLFVSSGASKWGNFKEYPYCVASLTSYRDEARIYAKYILGAEAGCQAGRAVAERRSRQGLSRRHQGKASATATRR